MAAPVPPLSPRPELAAVLLPGSSLTRFCRVAADLVALERGEWIAMLGAFGEEQGVVAGPPGSVAAGALGEPETIVTRRLAPEEVERAVASVARAVENVAQVSELAGETFPKVAVTGLRFTLRGIAVCSYQSQDPPSEVDCAVFAERLSHRLGALVRLEREPSGTPVVGTLGRPQAAPPDLTALVEARLGRLGATPHLGSQAHYPGGAGELIGVDVKHREARLRLPDGSEVVVPLDDLSQS